MRYLGIDYGAKNVGLAVSDELGEFAFPLVVLRNSKDLVREIVTLCTAHKVEAIVVGESKNFAQDENEIMKEILPFVETLERESDLLVYLHPEFMTSQEAERLQGHNDMHDASAAALILKSYLETIKNKK